MMHETWIGTKKYQIVTVFCVDYNLPTLFNMVFYNDIQFQMHYKQDLD